jgi:hypothetical protein
LIASLLAGYYWFQYTDFSNRIGGIPIHINVGFDYGVQPREMYNNVKALTGMTVFKVTRLVANVTYSTLAGFGVLVDSIDNVAYNGTHGWVWYKWNTFMLNWTRIDISSDAYAVVDGEEFLWYYETATVWPPPPPSP